MKGNLMRKNLMFVGGIIMIFTLASCGGTQKRTVVNYTPREVEQANQVMTYYNRDCR